MKEHPTEFAVAGAEGAEGTEEEEADTTVTNPTEAQEYAAQNRRARQDADFWQLQGALDSVMSGFSSIGSGVRTAFDTVSDLLSDSLFSRASFMTIIIAILLASNVYTYVARPESKHKEKRIQRFGPSEDDVAEAVRIVLDRRAATTPKEEISKLLLLLDEVDARSAALRKSLQVDQLDQPDALGHQDELD